jgi:hypothetical protein
MHRGRKSVLAISTTSLLCLFTALSGAALAGPAGGVKGDPQPELKPFKISNTNSSPGSIALEPNGSFVSGYDVPSGTLGKITVCVLARGGRKCSHTVALGTPVGDGLDTSAGPRVLVTSANHVTVIEDTCCDGNPHGDTFLWSSTDGGSAFGAPERIGNVVTGGATLIGKDIVFIGSDFPAGIQVESIPVGGAPPASVATLTGNRGDVGIGSYKGGVLAGSDTLGKNYATSVRFAAAGGNFNAAGSYHAVGTFGNEQLIAMSGSALLTYSGKGKGELVLRLFTGKGFGAAHTVPGTTGGGPEWFGLDQDPSGDVHVFSSRGFVKGYDLIEESTSNGSHWSAPANLGNAITSYSFAAALDSHGSGLVLGPGGSQVWAFPVLEAQNVSFALKSSTIKKGKSTTGSGKGSPAGVGRLVELQVQRGGRWYTVATTHEKVGGSFSFTIKGASAGTFKYRAVVSDLAGYLMYGYSNGKSLRVNR